jgi:hypothetical protein
LGGGPAETGGAVEAALEGAVVVDVVAEPWLNGNAEARADVREREGVDDPARDVAVIPAAIETAPHATRHTLAPRFMSTSK